MSCLLTQQMSCLLTQQMSCLQTQQMSCLQTQHLCGNAPTWVPTWFLVVTWTIWLRFQFWRRGFDRVIGAHLFRGSCLGPNLQKWFGQGPGPQIWVQIWARSWAHHPGPKLGPQFGPPGPNSGSQGPKLSPGAQILGPGGPMGPCWGAAILFPPTVWGPLGVPWGPK